MTDAPPAEAPPGVSAPPDAAVLRRLVVHVHGYQLTAPERFHRRFARDLATFGRTWSARTHTGAPEVGPHQARWQAHAAGPGWATLTDYRIVRLDDLIAVRHAQPLPRRVVQGLAGLFDFLLDPALPRYFRYGWRYALFALAPLAMIGLACLAGGLAGWWLTGLAGRVAGAAGGLAAFAGVIALAARRPWFLVTLLEDWAFASVLARRLEPGLAARLDEAAREVRAAVADETGDGPGYDEVLLIGHSLGAAIILHLAERVLAERVLGEAPAGEGAAVPGHPRLAILTIGSSVLKIALHSRAEALRAATTAVTASPRLVWAEYWSPQDVMNFPRTDPAKAMGVTARHPPIFRKAVFRQMLEPEEFRRLRFDFFRTHNLFFHAATRRAVYDYFMFVCGPFFAADLFRERDGATGWLDARGAPTAGAPLAAPRTPRTR